MPLSKVIPLLLPVALVTLLLSFYHVTVLTNENCLLHDDSAGFAIPSKGAHIPPTPQAKTLSLDSNYTGPYKIYRKWTHSFPCVPVEPQWKSVKVQRSPSKEGLLYVREMKTGSSTMAGVILGIAHRKAKPNNNGMPCKMRVDHSPAHVMEYAQRNKKRSFLISLLRDPTRRAMSQFFHFKVSDEGAPPTDQVFQEYFQNKKTMHKLSNYYVKDLSMTKIDDDGRLFDEMNNNYDSLVQDIINEYDFIGITERMDESLIVLKLLLDLDFGDILYMSAKNAGSFTAAGGGPKVKGRCIYIVPAFLTPGMKKFFASDYWKQFIAADVALYKAANASLDKTIESLGKRRVEKELAVFQRIKEQAQAKCESRTIYRCDATGKFLGQKNSTCLLWDVGCGHDCLDEFAHEMQI